MRIISNFKDYYDLQLKYGHDQALVYKRFTSPPHLIEGYKAPQLDMRHLGRPYRGGEVRTGAVYFCGEVHPFIVFRYVESTYDQDHEKYCSCCSDTNHTKFLYSMEAVDKLVDTLYAKEPKLLKSYHENGAPKYVRSSVSNRKDFEAVLSKDRLKILKEMASDVPVAVLEEHPYEQAHFSKNPQLSDYEFYRVFPGVLAFQELERYIGNLAIPMNPIPDIDDKSMAASKGYDKYSFRKAATKYPRKDR